MQSVVVQAVDWLQHWWPVFPILFSFFPSPRALPPHFPSASTFVKEGVLKSKSYLVKVDKNSQNMGVDSFPEYVFLFGVQWWPIWIFEVFTEGMIKAKKLILRMLKLDLSLDPIFHFGLPWGPGGPFGFGRRWAVPGGAAFQAGSNYPQHCWNDGMQKYVLEKKQNIINKKWFVHPL